METIRNKKITEIMAEVEELNRAFARLNLEGGKFEDVKKHLRSKRTSGQLAEFSVYVRTLTDSLNKRYEMTKEI